MFEGVLNTSMLWKAQDKKLVEYKIINLRDFGLGPRRTVDDTPYGGGDGMVLRIEPLKAAIDGAKSQISNLKSQIILLTPRGEKFTQAKAEELSKLDDIVLVCAHYEGYDERVVDFVDQQISIGDYVLTGGELPALIVVDAITRLIPGVLGGETSTKNESFSEGQNIEHPHYTRPEDFRGVKVPDVLLGGNHAAIEDWRRKNASKK